MSVHNFIDPSKENSFSFGVKADSNTFQPKTTEKTPFGSATSNFLNAAPAPFVFGSGKPAFGVKTENSESDQEQETKPAFTFSGFSTNPPTFGTETGVKSAFAIPSENTQNSSTAVAPNSLTHASTFKFGATSSTSPAVSTASPSPFGGAFGVQKTHSEANLSSATTPAFAQAPKPDLSQSSTPAFMHSARSSLASSMTGESPSVDSIASSAKPSPAFSEFSTPAEPASNMFSFGTPTAPMFPSSATEVEQAPPVASSTTTSSKPGITSRLTAPTSFSRPPNFLGRIMSKAPSVNSVASSGKPSPSLNEASTPSEPAARELEPEQASSEALSAPSQKIETASRPFGSRFLVSSTLTQSRLGARSSLASSTTGESLSVESVTSSVNSTPALNGLSTPAEPSSNPTYSFGTPTPPMFPSSATDADQTPSAATQSVSSSWSAVSSTSSRPALFTQRSSPAIVSAASSAKSSPAVHEISTPSEPVTKTRTFSYSRPSSLSGTGAAPVATAEAARPTTSTFSLLGKYHPSKSYIRANTDASAAAAAAAAAAAVAQPPAQCSIFRAQTQETEYIAPQETSTDFSQYMEPAESTEVYEEDDAGAFDGGISAINYNESFGSRGSVSFDTLGETPMKPEEISDAYALEHMDELENADVQVSGMSSTIGRIAFQQFSEEIANEDDDLLDLVHTSPINNERDITHNFDHETMVSRRGDMRLRRDDHHASAPTGREYHIIQADSDQPRFEILYSDQREREVRKAKLKIRLEHEQAVKNGITFEPQINHTRPNYSQPVFTQRRVSDPALKVEKPKPAGAALAVNLDEIRDVFRSSRGSYRPSDVGVEAEGEEESYPMTPSKYDNDDAVSMNSSPLGSRRDVLDILRRVSTGYEEPEPASQEGQVWATEVVNVTPARRSILSIFFNFLKQCKFTTILKAIIGFVILIYLFIFFLDIRNAVQVSSRTARLS